MSYCINLPITLVQILFFLLTTIIQNLSKMGGASEVVKKCLMWLLSWNGDPSPVPCFNALYKIFLLWNKTVRKKTEHYSATIILNINLHRNKHSYTTSMYRCYELCVMDKCMKPVGCITKPVTHLSLFNCSRSASWSSIFVVHTPFTFRWRFFFAWIARTVKWRGRTLNFTCTDTAMQ